MFNYLRNLRHSSFVSKSLPWEVLGRIYRLGINILPFNFTIEQLITQRYKFKLHAQFAFSNFKEWGNKHNNFFPVYIKLARTSKCFFDIEAHVGIATLVVAKNIKNNGVIYAFEPSKVNLKFLKYQIACNKIKIVRIADKLVSSSKKKTIFFEASESSGMNSIVSLNKNNINNKNFSSSIALDIFLSTQLCLS